MSLYFACLFSLLIRFHIQVNRSFESLVSPHWNPEFHSLSHSPVICAWMWDCPRGPPPCQVSSPPWLPVSAPPTSLDECFSNSLVVGLPCKWFSDRSGCSLFLNWLLSFFWLCKEVRHFCLCLHLGQNLGNLTIHKFQNATGSEWHDEISHHADLSCLVHESSLCPTSPCCIQYLPISHLVALWAIRSTITVSQYLCLSNPPSSLALYHNAYVSHLPSSHHARTVSSHIVTRRVSIVQ